VDSPLARQCEKFTMTNRSKDPFYSPRTALPIALALTLLAVSAPANGEVPQPGPPVQTANRSQPERPILGAYLRLPVTYTLLRGSEFDGRHVAALDESRQVYLPKISGGFGFKPSVGLQINHVAPHFDLMTGFAFGFSKHQAISYNVGNSWYAHPDATFYQVELELRALADLGRWKPFIGLSPGYAMLSLPKGTTVLDANRVVSWSDVTLRGISMEASLGLLFQILAPLAVDAAIGYRIQHLNSSGAGGISGFGFSPGWAASLGVVMSLQ